MEELFDDNIADQYLYDGEKDKCKLYPRYKIYPKTNGFQQAQNDKSCYFASFDASITAGLARGLWGWDIARKISKDEGKYDKSQERSHWNHVNTKSMAGMVAVVIVGIGAIVGIARWGTTTVPFIQAFSFI